MTTGILIVDDSGYMRERVKSAFQRDDFRIVDEAADGEQAVLAYKRHAEEIDIIMMDIVMTKANGVKATAAIKQIDPDARIVMVTSVGQRHKMKLAAKAGADGYVTKPFDDDELHDAIRKVSA